MNDELTEIELRKQIQAQVLRELVGQKIVRQDLSLPIGVNRKGLKHSISRRYSHARERLLALPEIPGLLAKARYVGKEGDNHLPPRPGIFMHRLQTTHVIQGQSYEIWLYVRETPGLMIFYDLGIVL